MTIAKIKREFRLKMIPLIEPDKVSLFKQELDSLCVQILKDTVPLAKHNRTKVSRDKVQIEYKKTKSENSRFRASQRVLGLLGKI